MGQEQDQTNKVTLKQIAQSPVAYMLMVAISVIWYFIYQFTASSDKVNKNCEAEKMELRRELSKERADKDALYISLLVRNEIISQQAQEKQIVDSSLNNKLAPKARKIVKEN